MIFRPTNGCIALFFFFGTHDHTLYWIIVKNTQLQGERIS
jgi:hypothetical protein